MSWLQLHGEVWPVTDDEADLRVYIRAPDVGCPRVWWDLDVSHYIKPENPPAGDPGIDRWLDIELGGLILNLRDWRSLAGLEIRADSAWHATQEFIGPYGHCHNSPRVAVYQTVLKPYAERAGVESGRKEWIAHDFILRFGNRDGWSFPCELDAWLIPKEEYCRLAPETPEETARFAEGMPDLRLVTRATFVRGSVDLARGAAGDPLSQAREILREQIGCDTMLRPKLNWMLRQTPGREEIVPMPGWRSGVHFFTTPGNIQMEKGVPAGISN
jgi:hypothetical protein